MREMNEIIVHCTATPSDWRGGQKTSTKVRAIKDMHLKRGWSDTGYHYLIDRDGTVAKGRPIERTGAHVRGRNKGTIGIALFGGHGGAADDGFAAHFTREQDKALRGLIGKLEAKYGGMHLSGHQEYAAKACPCFDAREWFAKVKTAPKKIAKPVPPQPETPKPKPKRTFWQILFGAKR